MNLKYLHIINISDHLWRSQVSILHLLPRPRTVSFRARKGSKTWCTILPFWKITSAFDTVPAFWATCWTCLAVGSGSWTGVCGTCSSPGGHCRSWLHTTVVQYSVDFSLSSPNLSTSPNPKCLLPAYVDATKASRRWGLPYQPNSSVPGADPLGQNSTDIEVDPSEHPYEHPKGLQK